MYQFPYSEIWEELPPRTVGPHARNLSDAIELINVPESAPSHQQQEVLSNFRRLWLLILEDVSRTSLDLPAHAQEKLLNIGNQVLNEIEQRRFRKSKLADKRRRASTGDRLI
jgi:flagellar biosynthesis regulator FlaF